MHDDTEPSHSTEDMPSDNSPEPPPDIVAGLAQFQDHYYDLLLSIADDIDPRIGAFRPLEDAKGAGRAQEMC